MRINVVFALKTIDPPLEVEPDELIEEVQKKIEKLVDLPVIEQNLILRGLQRSECFTLSYYNFKDGNNIHVWRHHMCAVCKKAPGIARACNTNLCSTCKCPWCGPAVLPTQCRCCGTPAPEKHSIGHYRYDDGRVSNTHSFSCRKCYVVNSSDGYF